MSRQKIFQRFIPLESENFIYLKNRSRFYIIIEISIFEGRTKETKKAFVLALFKNISHLCEIKSNDIQITIFETPKRKLGCSRENCGWASSRLWGKYLSDLYKENFQTNLNNYVLTRRGWKRHIN